MSETHITQTPGAPAPPAGNLTLEGFKKLIPTLLISVLAGGATSWWNGQKSQIDFQNRLQHLEEKSETNAKDIAQNSQMLQGNAVRIAEMGVIQQNTLEQIKDLKQEQNEILLLLNRK